MLRYAHPGSLVSTEWVAEHLNDPSVRLVEAIWGKSEQWGRPAYEGRHIPGAVAWDFENDLRDPARRDVVGKAGLEALLSRSGIAPETTIVLYSGLNNVLATFAFWLLKIYQHRDVRLLDGDRQKWLDEGRPVTSDGSSISPTTYSAANLDWSLRASREEVMSTLGQANHLIVDARSAEMFRGEEKPGSLRGGHIPGTVNLAARREMTKDGSFVAWPVPTVQPDDTFKSVEKPQALFEGLGAHPDRPITTYCLRGGLSTHA